MNSMDPEKVQLPERNVMIRGLISSTEMGFLFIGILYAINSSVKVSYQSSHTEVGLPQSFTVSMKPNLESTFGQHELVLPSFS